MKARTGKGMGTKRQIWDGKKKGTTGTEASAKKEKIGMK